MNELLITSGLEHIETEIGMAALTYNISLDLNKTLADIEIIEVTTLDDFKNYGSVMASVFDPFDHAAVKFYEKIYPYYKKNPRVKMLLGVINGNPAGICLSINSDGIGGVYDIVTHPSYQKRGIGTFMTKLAIKQLKEDGCRIAGMQASSKGVGIYQKLGFQEFGEFKVYSNKHMIK